MECATVAGLMAANRLVTLTGAGGCGKTRLSIQVAADVGETYADGVWWIDLARLTDDALLANAVAAQLAIKEVPGQQLVDTVKNHLRDQHVLVVLDNCEHVVDACAHLVHELLQACPSLSILTTSREPIGVEGEASWRVPSLQLPEPGHTQALESFTRSEAVRLLIDRAIRVKSSFRVTDDNAPAVAEICRRLDGIPLAIELAAARIRMMTPEQIVVGLENRFRLLTGSTRTGVPRHQTLRASADWSHELLSEEERAVLRRLAVFAGGFTLDASEEVCSGEGIARGAVLEIVARLVDRSLVHVGEEVPAARYRLLETIRQYADERLGESGEEDAVRARHLRFYVALAERAQPDMEGTGLLEWLPVLDVELDNVRAAFDWGIQTGAKGECVRLMSALWQFWFVRGHLTEGRRRFEVALDAGGTEPHLRAMALIDVGQLMAYHGDFVASHEFTTEALNIARTIADKRLEGRALDTLGYSTAFLDPPAAPDLFRASASLLRDAGDGLYLADALNGLGMARLFEGDYAGARAALEEGVASSRRIGNLSLLTIGLGLLGYTLELQGHLARARTCLRESLSIARRLKDRVSAAQSLQCLAFIDAHHGEHEIAEAHIEESVTIAREASPMILAFALLTDGLARYMRADLDGAESALEEMLLLSGDMPSPWWRAWSLALLGNAARIRGDLDGAGTRVEEALEAARAGGMRVDVPIDADARLARALGDLERAESLHHEALAAALGAQSILLVPMQLEALAGLAALGESFQEAARLFGAAEAARDAHGLARYSVDGQAYEADVERVRAALPDEEFRVAWQQGRAMSLDDAVAYASRGRGERKRPSAGWASLTPTEIEVVRHVAEGLTNPQIAERLFVSRSTVKMHLTHIFAKLAVSTRSELAAAATRRAV
jgi:predicted ATPase/DNA-binding CsgD family transcriptional regulator